MEYYVYILFSKSLGKHYIGSTSNVTSRFNDHNNGKSKFTSRGVPWELITHFPCSSKSLALILEKKIKSRGARRYLEDIKFNG